MNSFEKNWWSERNSNLTASDVDYSYGIYLTRTYPDIKRTMNSFYGELESKCIDVFLINEIMNTWIDDVTK